MCKYSALLLFRLQATNGRRESRFTLKRRKSVLNYLLPYGRQMCVFFVVAVVVCFSCLKFEEKCRF